MAVLFSQPQFITPMIVSLLLPKMWFTGIFQQISVSTYNVKRFPCDLIDRKIDR